MQILLPEEVPNNGQLNLAFANAVHDPSDKFYGDDEDDNFHIQ
jgi:hypothetical protein